MAAHALPATAVRAERLAMVDHMVRLAMAEADIPVRRVVDILLVAEADTLPVAEADIPVVVITNTRGELMYELM